MRRRGSIIDGDKPPLRSLGTPPPYVVKPGSQREAPRMRGHLCVAAFRASRTGCLS